MSNSIVPSPTTMLMWVQGIKRTDCVFVGHEELLTNAQVYTLMKASAAYAAERIIEWFGQEEQDRWLSPEECIEAIRKMVKQEAE